MKKGFTLIELLAVIVILGIIMVIAVPQILNVINSSRQSAWTDNVKLIKSSLELDYSMNNTTSAISSANCTSDKLEDKLVIIAKLDTSATTVSDVSYDNSTCSFKLNPIGQFSNSGNKVANITCTSGKCTITYLN